MLTPRQEAFVAEFLVDLNATQAATRAGYSATTAAEQGSRLLSRADIAEAIERAKAQRLSRVGMTQDTVLHELSLLSHSSVAHYVVTDDGDVALSEGAPAGAMSAVQSIKKRTRVFSDGSKTYEVELRLWDKVGPLKLMGRHAGLFTDRLEHSGPSGGAIEAFMRIERVIVDGPHGR